MHARLAAALGVSGVFCAAFGAHGLERHAVEGGLRWWAIAVVLQLTTTPALLALAFAPPGRARTLSTAGLSVGLVLFSGTLYAMALGAPRWLGAVTPLGGLLLAGGWFAVGFVARDGGPPSK
jgi:uncharacterized membrane protein YgdD (TMEM256/DUF423 family)